VAAKKKNNAWRMVKIAVPHTLMPITAAIDRLVVIAAISVKQALADI